jgi:hypothetical protein
MENCTSHQEVPTFWKCHLASVTTWFKATQTLQVPKNTKERCSSAACHQHNYGPTYSLTKHLTSLLGPHLGNSLYHVINSEDFIHTLDTDWSTLVTSTASHLSPSFQLGIHLICCISILMKRILDCSIVSWFLCFRKFYEQTDGVAMDSLLSPVVTICIELFKEGGFME